MDIVSLYIVLASQPKYTLLSLFVRLLLLIFSSSLPAQRCEEFTDLDLAHAILGTNLKIRLLLYTRDNISCGSLLSHTNLSAHPQFNFTRPTTFVLHGYRPTGSPPIWVTTTTRMLLEREDMNVIVVDWNHGAANVNYLRVVENTHKAADNLTAFVKIMQVSNVFISTWVLLLSWCKCILIKENLDCLCVTRLLTNLHRNMVPLQAPSTWSESVLERTYQDL